MVYRTLGAREAYPPEPVKTEPALEQRWMGPDGIEFTIHDYTFNAVYPWECRGDDGRRFRLGVFDDCTFIEEK